MDASLESINPPGGPPAGTPADGPPAGSKEGALLSEEDTNPALVEVALLARRLLPGTGAAVVFPHGTVSECLIADDGGVRIEARPTDDTLCAQVMSSVADDAGLWVISDAAEDRRTRGHPRVDGRLGRIRSYAAAAVESSDGTVLGALCVYADRPRAFDPSHARQLKTLGHRAVTALASSERRPVTAVPRPARLRRPDQWTLAAVLAEEAVTPLFQPVVHLSSGEIVGFEALSRGPKDSPVETPRALIQEADAAGRLGELDWLCRAKAMAAAAEAHLPASVSWLINVEPAGLAIPCPPRLWDGIAAGRSDLRVILEVIERDLQGHVTELLHATDQARQESWGVALDDVGAEVGQLALLPFLRPDVVKLDMSLIRGEPDERTAAVTAAIAAYAEQTGATILAEGIETSAERARAEVFGATYGQGWYYGKPGPLPDRLANPRHVIPLRQNVEPLGRRTPFDVLTQAVESRRSEQRHLAHIGRHIAHQARLHNPAVLLASFDDPALLASQPLDQLDRMPPGNALTVVCGPGLDPVNEPHWEQRPVEGGNPLGAEWTMAAISPHYAAAFAARPVPFRGSTYDYAYTHDRDLVVAAMRAYLTHGRPVEVPIFLASVKAPTAGSAPARHRPASGPRVLRFSRRPTGS